jgi:hypothetical protein
MSQLTIVAGVALLALVASPALVGACDETFDSTFALIQKAIFERRGCTSSLCHDAAASGGLDLLPDVAYDNLVDAPVQSIAAKPPLVRVYPAKKEHSLLWINLAAATLPDQWKAPLRPMPLGGLPPLTLDELEVVRLWIEHGAPREGVVDGTGALLDACLPPPQPLETAPLAPPAAGTGVQFRAPRQILTAHTEREVCFVTYYDISDQVPAVPSGRRHLPLQAHRCRMDPLSHAVVIPYRGVASPRDIWGPFTCGGPSDGQSNPRSRRVWLRLRQPACRRASATSRASIGVGNDGNTMAAGLGDGRRLRGGVAC